MRHYTIINIIILFFIISKISQSEEFYTKLNYNIQFSNFSIAEVKITIKNLNGNYSFDMNTSSVGVLEKFYKYKSHIYGYSVKDNNKIIPKIYSVNSTYKNKGMKSEVRWNDTKSDLIIKNIPKMDYKKVRKIPKDSIYNVIDPFSSIVNMIQNLENNNTCINEFRVFDGRRRYNIQSIEIGRQFLQKDRPNTFEGYVIICGLRFFPIGGQRIESNWRPEHDKYSDIKVFFGSKNNSLLPVRLEIQRWFGKIITRLVI